MLNNGSLRMHTLAAACVCGGTCLRGVRRLSVLAYIHRRMQTVAHTYTYAYVQACIHTYMHLFTTPLHTERERERRKRLMEMEIFISY